MATGWRAAPAVVVALLFALPSCSDNAGGPVGPQGVVGNYSLETVDGSPLPYAVPQPPGAEVLAGSVSLQVGSTYDLFLDYRDKVDTTTYEEEGNWGLFAGDSIFFRPTGPFPVYRGRIANGVISVVTADGLQLRFAR